MDIVGRDLRARHDLLVYESNWFTLPLAQPVHDLFPAAEHRFGIHAGDIETSLMLAGAAADTVRMDKARAGEPASVAMDQEFTYLNASRPAGFGWATQDLDPSGAIGDPTRATAATWCASRSASKSSSAFASAASPFASSFALS